MFVYHFCCITFILKLRRKNIKGIKGFLRCDVKPFFLFFYFKLIKGWTFQMDMVFKIEEGFSVSLFCGAQFSVGQCNGIQ